ncbi:30S ribosomal protein S3 [Candidatus Woesearchaeota archaeon]|nr:30S ribosomal protein S3 [Candidatus Woesearchaeota archaeon]
MIEKKILAEKMKRFEIQEYVRQNLKRVGLSDTKLQMTPLGEKVIIYASRPGLIVGRKGQSIKRLTNTLKKKFNLENPQIEINEIENLNFDANIVAERIANSLEKFGSARFKGVGHKAMEDVMNAGALGIEILISGKVPSSRAKRWRFYQGFLKKSGDVAVTQVKTAYTQAQLKSGTLGIQVRIMPPDVILPDKIKMRESSDETQVQQDATAKKETGVEEGKEDQKKKRRSQQRARKSKAKKEAGAEEGKEEAVKEDTHEN